MKILERIEAIYSSIKKSLRRFPVTIAICTAFVIISIIINEKNFGFQDPIREIYERIRMIIALGIPLSLCITTIQEQRSDLKNFHKIFGHILGAIGLIIYYIFLLKDLSMVSTIRYTAISLFLYLAFAYIPRLRLKGDYEFYIINMFSSFLLTGIYSFVLLMGIFAIYFTINQLFNIDILLNNYYYTFLIVAGIFAPSMFLARVPETDENFKDYNYPKGLKALLIYIVIPLITVYTLILYIYFGQILITRNWPKGLVSHLVLWYSTVSVAVIFFISPILDESHWANRFKNWFPKLNIPILFMMFTSMGIRINQYGITEKRYLALVLGLWVLGIMFYFIFSKKQRNIIIPIVLSIIIINSGFGPLSSFSISKWSQNRRLKSLLVENNMLKNNEIAKNEDIDRKDKEEISMVLDYFHKNHSLEKIKYLPKDFEIKAMESTFGFPFTEPSLHHNNYLYLATKYEEQGIINTRGYDYLIESYKIYEDNIEINNVDVFYNRESMIFTLKEKGSIIYEMDMEDYGQKILKNREEKINNKRNLLSMDEATIIDENENVKTKFIINTISGKLDREDNFHIEHMEFSILIKFK